MVDTRKLKRFIKLADLDESDIIQFVDEGKITEKDFSKAQDGSKMETALVMKVSLNGEDPKEITLNNTTINILKKDWGSETANWVGKRAKVAVVETLSFGELKEVNVLKPIKEQQDAPPAYSDPEPEDTVQQAPQAEKNYCTCEAGTQPRKHDPQRNVDVCETCGKDIVAWDE